MFSASIILLALGTASLPLVVQYGQRLWPRIKMYSASAWLPILAGVLMVASVLLPDVHISGETSTFQQHFVGGGLYCACLYVYAKQLFGWRLHWLADLLVLFAWVSAFGVANKLAEFALLQAGLLQLDVSDAYWDLLANTLGCFVGYGLLYWYVGPRRSYKQK